MGYEIRAFVAKKGTFEKFKALSPYVTVAELNQGFDLMLTDWCLSEALEIPDHSEVEGYVGLMLNRSTIEIAAKLSRTVPIAYIEADYHGGHGYQSAVVLKDGKVILKPDNNGVFNRSSSIGSTSPINAALRALGVIVERTDEFETIGLSDHRSMEDWFVANTDFDEDDY